jgi:hypothetical protein
VVLLFNVFDPKYFAVMMKKFGSLMWGRKTIFFVQVGFEY